MTHLSVREWGRVPVCNDSGPVPVGHFSRKQANELIFTARDHAFGGDEGTGILRDHYQHLTAQQMVGVIATDGCSLEILPKIEVEGCGDDMQVRRRLVHMLNVAYGLDIGEGAATSMARQNETLLDVLIRSFSERLLVQARTGLPREYIACEADLPKLRGRLDVLRQFTANAVRPDRLACRFDALSPDLALMQVMKACVVFLRRFARSQATQRQLDELRFLFSDVSDVRPCELPWERVRIDRTSRRWEVLYTLARLFLKREWQATHHSPKSAEGITFLFPMNDLFEAYVAAQLSRALRETDLSVQSQGGRLHCLLEDGVNGKSRFQTKPDLLIKRGREVIAIADTKWKRLAPEIDDPKRGITQADIYQMMAYSRLYLCSNLILIYPYHSGLGPTEIDAGFVITNSDDRIRTASINIASDQQYVQQRLRSLCPLQPQFSDQTS